MTKRMLIDATHAEETRVVVLDGNRLEDFDVETSTKRQLKGNIYLAKVIRVEPSLQAAFVEYGGGRHGFLAFSEIHPDYYQIPVADRQRLLELQAQEAREEEEAEDRAAVDPRHRPHPATDPVLAANTQAEPPAEIPPEAAEAIHTEAATTDVAGDSVEPPPVAAATDEPAAPTVAEPAPSIGATGSGDEAEDAHSDRPAQQMAIEREERFGPVEGDTGFAETERSDLDAPTTDMPPPETVGGESDGGDGGDEARARRASRILRNYRIQEVIKRRQIMLVQVVKEERGTKGAALTTYISLAGRFCVLMPNSPRGGGISRKITSAADRRRLKEITSELEIPHGMGLIVRTAGANRPKPEIRRDCEYLMRLWDDIREHTMRSVAPALIYEEASLIKRAIRDVYSRDVDEITVDGEDGWRGAHEFMRMLMPSHAKKVQLWRGEGAGPAQPLFARYQVEAQLDAMLAPTVQLRSGGYLVINQTEALVAIDVNSGRSTRERGIEETALRTNMEAADEVARQLRLRDLAGLIVIDFIDMEARKHNAMVERRLKEALKIDRARIQVGHISHFGLLEMSRQRLRPSLAETSFSPCPHCGGTGHVRSTESSAIHVLRAIEEEGSKGRAAVIRVQVASAVALYLLNHKRDRLAAIEQRYAMLVHFDPDDTLVPPQIRIERVKPQVPDAIRAMPGPVAPAAPAFVASDEDVPDLVTEEDAEVDEAPAAAVATPVAADAAPAQSAEARAQGDEAERRRRRRRRRRGGRRDDSGTEATAASASDDAEADEGLADGAGEDDAVAAMPVPVPLDPALAEQPDIPAIPPAVTTTAEEEERARRRGRRGGRRRRRDEPAAEPETPDAPPPAVYTGPTPADPFGGGAFDIFDMIEQHEARPPAAPVTQPQPVQQAASVAPPEAAAVAEPVAAPEPVAPPETAAEAEEPLIVEALPIIAALPSPVTEAEATPHVEPVAEATPEPAPEPAIKPILVGQDDMPAERKRGWWRQ